MEKVQTKIIVCITIAVIVLLVLYQQRTTDEKFISVDNVDIHDLHNYYTEYKDFSLKQEKKNTEEELDKQTIFKKIHTNAELQREKKNYLDDIISKNKKLQEDKILSTRDILDATLVSNYNSDNISIMPVGDNKFKIRVNDKCLTVIGDKDYSVKECTVGDYAQYFTSRKISDADEAAYWTNSKVSDKHSYPYYNVQSNISPHNCLTGGDDIVSIEKCNGNNIKQHWQIEPRQNICIDTRD